MKGANPVKKSDEKLKIGIIGYGRMGSSLIDGAIRSGLISPDSVLIYDTDAKRSELAREKSLKTASSLEEIASCDVVILAVKPKDMPQLLENLGTVMRAYPTFKPLVVSIAAGVRLSTLQSALGGYSRIVRAMPNIAASVNESASVFVPSNKITDEDLVVVKSILDSVGLAFMVRDESLLDVVTGIVGSGPAYFFLLMKIMEEIGIKYGLSRDLVRRMVAQTCKGSGKMALVSKESFEQLISAVASPGGTTEEALKIMDSKGLAEIISQAISAAIEKSRKMASSASTPAPRT
ncbi:MAG: pyrroline-5-carboxylate reductase [Candidatus Methanomethylicia archaeon]|jgi:pyrroline-5-carboxylate reductase|nr:pyrroline-5-carboxylate reductase [Candidatus Methanomethylicia archaeon]